MPLILGALGLLALVLLRRGAARGGPPLPSAAAGWQWGGFDDARVSSPFPEGWNTYGWMRYAYPPYWEVGATPAGAPYFDAYATLRDIAAGIAANMRTAPLPPGVTPAMRDDVLHQLGIIADPTSSPEAIHQAIAAIAASGQAWVAAQLQQALPKA